ncbi:MAG: hypothetical protein U9P71_04280 [Campylobacterota bacterium]|nr:hypothetical protein [Campylobacterota bacterium]
MAKKKKSIEYSSENILFIIDKIKYKLIRFHPSSMAVDVKIIEDDAQKGMVKIGFAQLPREIKQLVKPQK